MNDDDTLAPKKPAYALGDDLSHYSVEELQEVIAACRREIVRLEEELTAKRASIATADAIFKS